MFVISKSATFSWPVSIKLPADGGKYEASEFNATFKRMTQTELAALFGTAGMTDRAMCDQILVGWDNVVDDAGDFVPFDAGKDSVLDIPTVAGQIVLAYSAAIEGASRKN